MTYLDNTHFEATILQYRTNIALQEKYKAFIDRNPHPHLERDYQQLVQSHEQNKHDLWACFQLIAQMLRLPEDVIQEVTIHCVNKQMKWEPDKGTAFTYFTTIIKTKHFDMFRKGLEDKRKWREYYSEKTQ